MVVFTEIVLKKDGFKFAGLNRIGKEVDVLLQEFVIVLEEVI